MNSKSSKPNQSSPFNFWLQAQNQFWQGWSGMLIEAMFLSPFAGKETRPDEEDTTSTPIADMQLINTQRQKLWLSNLEAWTGSAAPIARTSAEQFYAVQQATIRLLELIGRTWSAIAFGASSSDEVKSAIEQGRQQALQDIENFPKDIASALGDFSEFVMYFLVSHIGMYVSGSVQKSLPPAITKWIKGRP